MKCRRSTLFSRSTSCARTDSSSPTEPRPSPSRGRELHGLARRGPQRALQLSDRLWPVPHFTGDLDSASERSRHADHHHEPQHLRRHLGRGVPSRPSHSLCGPDGPSSRTQHTPSPLPMDRRLPEATFSKVEKTPKPPLLPPSQKTRADDRSAGFDFAQQLETMSRLLLRCKEENTTFHGLLSAATLLALAQEFPGERRSLWLPTSTCGAISFLPSTTTTSAASSPK